MKNPASAGFFVNPNLWEQGLPAMVVNDDAGQLIPRGGLWFFASKLAPTGGLAVWLFDGQAQRSSPTPGS